MSRKTRTPKSASNSAPQLTRKQQAAGVALAGGSIATPLLLALLDKALSFEEVQAICSRAREIAGNFDDLPEGKYALACIDDFLLPRTPSSPEANSPAIVPSDDLDSSQRSDNEDATTTRS